MKTWHSEYLQNYGTYTFGYGAYASIEPGDSLSATYEQGFLPYSGSPEVRNVFYMARGARVELAAFEPTSENRRVLKRFDGSFTKSPISAAEFVSNDEVMAFCLSYFEGRHSAKVMPHARLELILSHNAKPTGVRYERDGQLAALTLCVEDASMTHFWFSFYDLTFVEQSLGMWLMLDAARDAKALGKNHFYLGTVYGEKALYKANFPALSWWDGQSWQNDTASLKARARTDAERTSPGADAWKQGGTLF